jgi:pyruvate formate lyase activating enzyme
MTETGETPVETLRLARETGLDAGLRYVYIGNMPGLEGQSTYCPGCGKLLIERSGYGIVNNLIDEGSCPECRSPIAGVGMGRLN